jgi:hypothetical protein
MSKDVSPRPRGADDKCLRSMGELGDEGGGGVGEREGKWGNMPCN